MNLGTGHFMSALHGKESGLPYIGSQKTLKQEQYFLIMLLPHMEKGMYAKQTRPNLNLKQNLSIMAGHTRPGICYF